METTFLKVTLRKSELRSKSKEREEKDKREESGG
jgi:hypothetical protein